MLFLWVVPPLTTIITWRWELLFKFSLKMETIPSNFLFQHLVSKYIYIYIYTYICIYTYILYTYIHIYIFYTYIYIFNWQQLLGTYHMQSVVLGIDENIMARTGSLRQWDWLHFCSHSSIARAWHRCLVYICGMSNLAEEANLHIIGSNSRLNGENALVKMPGGTKGVQQSRQASGSLHGGHRQARGSLLEFP